MAGYDPSIDHLAVVREVRSRLPAQTKDDCVRLCAAVARVLRARGEDAGLLLKRADQTHGVGPDGQRYAIDAIVYPDGRGYDCLYSAPEVSEPSWADISGTFDVTLVCPPFAAGDPDPPVPETPWGEVLGLLRELQARLEALERITARADRLELLFQSTAWPMRGKLMGFALTGQVGPNRER